MTNPVLIFITASHWMFSEWQRVGITADGRIEAYLPDATYALVILKDSESFDGFTLIADSRAKVLGLEHASLPIAGARFDLIRQAVPSYMCASKFHHSDNGTGQYWEDLAPLHAGSATDDVKAAAARLRDRIEAEHQRRNSLANAIREALQEQISRLERDAGMEADGQRIS